MRTLTEILNAIRADFVANKVLQDAYGLDAAKTFDEQFSKVSIEAIFTYIAAMALFTFEKVLAAHYDAVYRKIATQAVCSVPWYYQKCLEFQLGDAVVVNPDNYQFGYEVTNEAKRIIKFAAVRQIEIQGVTYLRIYVSKANKQALTTAELEAFRSYIKNIGAAGVHYEIYSAAPEKVAVKLEVTRDPLQLDTSGNLLSGGANSVNTALKDYFDNIIYGGAMNKTKLVDAVQAAPGVKDVVLLEVKSNGIAVEFQNYESASGCFEFDLANSVISYNG